MEGSIEVSLAEEREDNAKQLFPVEDSGVGYSELEQEGVHDALEEEVIPADVLETLMMDEDEFKFYIKPAVLPRMSPDPSAGETLEFSQELDVIRDIVAKSGATIFSETDDLICEQALNIIKSLKLTINRVQLNLIEGGEKIKNLVFGYSGLNSLPIILINGQLVGGYQNLWYLYYTGLVSHLLTRESISFRNSISFDYHVIVIGGGPAGISAALEAGKLGKRVALLDYVTPSARGQSWGIGGTYINAGSISKNLMYAASSFVHSFKGHGSSKPKQGTADWRTLVNNIGEHIKSIRFSLRSKLKEAGCEYLNARAKFITDHTIEVTFPNNSGKKLLTSSVFIIATGSRPRYPHNMQGASRHCYTTDDFFWSARPPGKTLILSASHIGLECATVLANFNFPVSVLLAPPIGKYIDWEILRRTKSLMENIKIRFLQEIQINCIERQAADSDKQPNLNVKGISTKNIPYEESFDTVIMDFGRIPNTAHLGLCKIGVKVHNRTRKIIVDGEGRTNIKHIFVLGDVAHGWPELGTVAKKAGKMLIQRLYKAYLKHVDLRFVPERYLFPVEYARIGKTEQAARAIFGEGIKPYEANSHVLGTLSNSPIRAYFYMKIICIQREKEDEVIAVHILCHKAAEIIQGLSISLRKGVTKKDFEDMIALHPIFSEVVSNMKLMYYRTPLDVYKAAQKTHKNKAAMNALQTTAPFKTSKCRKVVKHPVEEVEEEEETDESAKEAEIRRNKVPRISKGMENFIKDVILGEEDTCVEAEEERSSVSEGSRSEEDSSSEEAGSCADEAR